MADKPGVIIDDAVVLAYLGRFSPDEMQKLLLNALLKGGQAERGIMRGGTPVGRTGNLRASVNSRRIRKGTVAGMVVAPMGRKGSHRGMVVTGTRPHTISPRGSHKVLRILFGYAEVIHHPGSRPNPFVSRIAAQAEEAAVAAAVAALDEVLA